MATKNITKEVQERIKKLTGDKAEQLAKIHQKQNEARNQIEAAGLAIREATEVMNLEAYEKATADKRKAQAALDMYSGRYDQIRKQEYVTEADSDSVISSLLEYEDTLAEDFKKAIAEPLKKLADLYKGYKAAVVDTENTIKNWERNIHANYSTRGGTKYKNETTGEWTDRSPSPVPVHRLPYTGCSEAIQLGQYLKGATELYAED